MAKLEESPQRDLRLFLSSFFLPLDSHFLQHILVFDSVKFVSDMKDGWKSWFAADTDWRPDRYCTGTGWCVETGQY